MINTDYQHEDFDLIRDLNKKGDHNHELIIEGIPAIRAAIDGGHSLNLLFTDVPVDELLLNKDYIKKTVFTDRVTLSKVVGFPFHRHAIASIDRPSPQPLNSTCGPYVFLNGVSSPENVGSIVRTCVAFGIQTIIFDYTSCSPFIRRCVRVSMGNCFRLAVVKSESALKDLSVLKSRGYEIISLELSQRSVALNQTALPNNSVLIFGSEGHGVDEQILNLSDRVVKIEMAAEVGSLNVSQSAAIALYHLSKN
jgi:tRNA G18 (ribose-2'-O)-methylase SpoU